MLYHKYKPLAVARLLHGAGAAAGAVARCSAPTYRHTLPGFSRIMARLGLTGLRRAAAGREDFPADRVRGPLAEGADRRWCWSTRRFAVVVRRRSVVLSWPHWSGWARKDVDMKDCPARLSGHGRGRAWCWCKLLHFATPLMPYNFYCRNWDFGYGHYNGFGARLVGRVLRLGRGCGTTRLRAYRLGGAGRAGDFHLQGSRQPRGVRRHGGACLCCSLCRNSSAELFDNKIFVRAWRWLLPVDAGGVQPLRRVCLQPRVAL